MGLSDNILASLFPYLDQGNDNQYDAGMNGGVPLGGAPNQTVQGTQFLGVPTPPPTPTPDVQPVDTSAIANADPDIGRYLADTPTPPADTRGIDNSTAIDTASPPQTAMLPGQGNAITTASPLPNIEQQAKTAIDSMSPIKPNDNPPFVPPIASPTTELDRAKNQEAQLEYDAQYGQNKGHGIKQVLSSLLQNFAYGLSKTPQGATVAQALTLGAGGAAGGLISPNWNARRNAQEALPQAQQRVAFQQQIANQQNEITNRDAEAKIRQQQASHQITKDDYDKLSDARKQVMDEYKAMPEVDFNTPEGKALKAQADKAGVIIGEKSKDDTVEFHIAPDGTPIIFNKSKQTYTKGPQGEFAKPPDYTTTNSKIDNDNVKDLNDWKSTVTENEGKRTKVQGDIDSTNVALENLTQSNNVLRDQLSKLDPIKVYGDEAKAKELTAKIQANDSKALDLHAQIPKLLKDKAAIKDAPKPIPRPKVVTPTTKAPVAASKDPLGILK